jgi:hypothetical protein
MSLLQHCAEFSQLHHVIKIRRGGIQKAQRRGVEVQLYPFFKAQRPDTDPLYRRLGEPQR